ncbi:MAG TPA: hypothetical protein VHB68_10815, partial [Steroidobacteraceae bacterium]|nr:hypothetical protein [Steroidobacteraceae bacterium]
QRMESRWTSPAARPSAGPAYEVSVDETEPRDGARAGSINEEPSSESDDGAGVSSGLDDWRTQSALLLADIPTDALPDADETVALPGADDTLKLEMTGETLIAEKETNTLSLADLERAAAMPTQGTSAIRLGRTGLEAGDGEATEELRAPREETRASSGTDRTASNREIVEVLESTLGIQPGRVDIQLKLLEIYHQEALGNRDNFHSLLRKLSLDPKTLTPAQLLHIETLQRTLDDGKRNAEVAEVGVSMG